MLDEKCSAKLHQDINAQLDRWLDYFYRQVPSATHLLNANQVSLDYYKRHMTQLILRIRRKRTIDALVIYRLTKSDPRQAKAWAKYTEEEMLHDALFVQDLEHLNVTRDEIYDTEPFLSMKLLDGYFYYTLEYEGPLASLAGAYVVEYTSRRTQPSWIANLEKSFGRSPTAGVRRHLLYDVNEDHESAVWAVVVSQVKVPEDERRLLVHVDAIASLLCAYFTELHTITMAPQDRSSMTVARDTVLSATGATLRTN